MIVQTQLSNGWQLDIENTQKYGGQKLADVDKRRVKQKCKPWTDWIKNNRMHDMTHLDQEQFKSLIPLWLKEYDQEHPKCLLGENEQITE